jgi:hypothetical protein
MTQQTGAVRNCFAKTPETPEQSRSKQKQQHSLGTDQLNCGQYVTEGLIQVLRVAAFNAPFLGSSKLTTTRVYTAV